MANPIFGLTPAPQRPPKRLGQIMGLQTSPAPGAPFEWRVFVNTRADLERWSAALGGEVQFEILPADADLSRCELNHLYAWGEAPLSAHAPPPPPRSWRERTPMWHPKAPAPRARTHHISDRSRAASEFQ